MTMTANMKLIAVGLVALSFLVRLGVCRSQCACGDDKPSGDIDVLGKVRTAAAKKVFPLLKGYNKGVCVSYEADFNPLRISFTEEAIKEANVDDKICEKNKDGSIDCTLKHPTFDDPERCYPAQQFCAYDIKCPPGHSMSFHCSGLDMPMNDKKQCRDEIMTESDRIGEKSFCGTTQGCGGFGSSSKEEFREFGSTFRLTFVSGLCCQNCGYHFTVRCNPEPFSRTNLAIITTSAGTKTILGSAIRPPSPITHIIPKGAKIVYKYKQIVIYSQTGRIIQRIRANTLYVRDDVVFGFNKWRRFSASANRKFVGYGEMKVFGRFVRYHQMGIPPEERPNPTERQFIGNAINAIVKYRKNKKSKTSHISNFATFTSSFIIGPPRPDPKCQGPNETVVSRGECSSTVNLPNYRSLLWDARRYASGSSNSYTRSMAKRVLSIIKIYPTTYT